MHLIDADKIFMIFAIRDLTMTDRGQERKMMVDYDCPHCGHVNKKDISHYDFGFLKIPEELMKWYDDKERCFVINHTLFQGKPIYAAPPSIGLTSKVIDYIQSKQSSNVLDQQADAMEIDMLQFIRVKDFRSYDKDIIQGKIREFGTWPEAKYQAMVALIRRLTKSTNPTYNIKCGDNTLKGCDREFDAPIRFRFADIHKGIDVMRFDDQPYYEFLYFLDEWDEFVKEEREKQKSQEKQQAQQQSKYSPAAYKPPKMPSMGSLQS
jgi:hypothetical protein